MGCFYLFDQSILAIDHFFVGIVLLCLFLSHSVHAAFLVLATLEVFGQVVQLALFLITTWWCTQPCLRSAAHEKMSDRDKYDERLTGPLHPPASADAVKRREKLDEKHGRNWMKNMPLSWLQSPEVDVQTFQTMIIVPERAGS